MLKVFPFDLDDHTVTAAVSQLNRWSPDNTLHHGGSHCALRMTCHEVDAVLNGALADNRNNVNAEHLRGFSTISRG